MSSETNNIAEEIAEEFGNRSEVDCTKREIIILEFVANRILAAKIPEVARWMASKHYSEFETYCGATADMQTCKKWLIAALLTEFGIEEK